MADLKSQTFAKGSEVRVRGGVTDPDFIDIPIGGWVGTVIKLAQGPPPMYLVRWSEATLEVMHPVFCTRCERDGLDWKKMWLEYDDLELNHGREVEIEPLGEIQPSSLSEDDE